MVIVDFRGITKLSPRREVGVGSLARATRRGSNSPIGRSGDHAKGA